LPRYILLISRKADKFLEDTREKLRKTIISELTDLENFPLFEKPHDLAKIKGHRDYYRLRLGDIRVIFRLDRDNHTIYVEKIGRRENVYG